MRWRIHLRTVELGLFEGDDETRKKLETVTSITDDNTPMEIKRSQDFGKDADAPVTASAHWPEKCQKEKLVLCKNDNYVLKYARV